MIVVNGAKFSIYSREADIKAEKSYGNIRRRTIDCYKIHIIFHWAIISNLKLYI